MISHVIIYFKDGKIIDSKYYELSFHGLELNGNVYKYLSEKSPLIAKDLDQVNRFYYFPYEEIARIEETFE